MKSEFYFSTFISPSIFCLQVEVCFFSQNGVFRHRVEKSENSSAGNCFLFMDLHFHILCVFEAFLLSLLAFERLKT